MTKNLLILLLFFLTGLKLNAQCTPDNNITKPGFYPSSIPDAILNTPYNEVVQFKFFKDTMILYQGFNLKATIDSVTIVKVDGMPPGLTFQLNKTSKTYTPAVVGCALVSGTPTVSGSFKLSLILNIYAKVSTFKVERVDTLDNFNLVVKKDASISDLGILPNLVYPNPLVGDWLTINDKFIESGTILTVFNSQGQMIKRQSVEKGANSILFNFTPGIYLLRFENQNKAFQARLIRE